MNLADIVRIAREAGFGKQDADGVERIERFATLVAASERERCAKVCEEWGGARKPRFGGFALRNVASAIRDLGDGRPEESHDPRS